MIITREVDSGKRFTRYFAHDSVLSILDSRATYKRLENRGLELVFFINREPPFGSQSGAHLYDSLVNVTATGVLVDCRQKIALLLGTYGSQRNLNLTGLSK